MILDLLAAPVAIASAAAVAGLAFGLVYFRALRRTTDLLAGGGGWRGPIALTLIRIVGAVILFAMVARLGALPLLGAFIGLLAARTIALRGARRTA